METPNRFTSRIMDVLRTIHQKSKQLRAQVFPANMHGFSGHVNIFCMARIEPRMSLTSPSPATPSSFRLDAFRLVCRSRLRHIRLPTSGLGKFMVADVFPAYLSSRFGLIADEACCLLSVLFVAFRLNRRRGMLPFRHTRHRVPA